MINSENVSSPGDLYTNEQKEYVNGIKDEDLRSHLLYQVRLCDNLSRDRDEFERLSGRWPSLNKALARLLEELKGDKGEGSYYYSWQANIAMAFFDQFLNDHEGVLSNRQLSEVANKAAKRFLESLLK